jgi:rhodanese-related sulfurtransferase
MKNAHDLVLEAKKIITEVPENQAEKYIGEADLLIDVREADEFANGHLAGAMNIPRGLLEFKMSGTETLMARDLNIVLYCKTSGRAALAAQTLQAMGYKSVTSIAGGIDAWIQAGKPIVKPKLPSFD